MTKINVTQTFLPPKDEYIQYLDRAWDKKWLTNNGDLLQELEEKVTTYLDSPEMMFVTNGTIALQFAIRALDVSGEVITTPFSYIATATSILWENSEPIFVDIDPDSLNIDPKKIEAAITSSTSAILATHVFGNPCDIEAIERIAKKYNLKVIYDAAHCFGVAYNSKSIFSYGDISTVSFHATKLYHTVEGGGVFSSDKEVIERIQFLRNFGHHGPGKFKQIGINGKNSELHAAMGLANLKYIDAIIEDRKKTSHLYDELLDQTIRRQKIRPDTQYNFAYYPVIFSSEQQLLDIEEKLNRINIFPRRYFYPSLNTLDYLNKKQLCPVSEDIAKRILCLPLYYKIPHEVVHTIANTIKE